MVVVVVPEADKVTVIVLKKIVPKARWWFLNDATNSADGYQDGCVSDPSGDSKRYRSLPIH